MRLLLVEDHQSLSEWLSMSLHRQNYSVDCAYDGEEADNLLLTQPYDLVVLDLSLPRLNGDKVLQRLRARHNQVPVLILTANNSLEGRIEGLNMGADDYMAKPFEMVELEARIRALLRRSHQNTNPLLQCGSLSYDSNSRLFTLGETPLSLTRREHAILENLINKVGKTVSKPLLAESLFTINEEASAEAIEVYVHRLRKKLENSNVTIITLRGLGYLLKEYDATTS